ncbi:hypothetical protein DXG03_001869 [Asterophora parasitica]|uniref:Uncharacterized protein n=1 Tax=Asterophora parasitica TaxID=117018 RepID=A0A9P7G385_9AGAR|nr:hypothetical protein DXG03_001869 [Asterophora parasitica]
MENNFILSFCGTPLRSLRIAHVNIPPHVLNRFLATCDILEELSLDLPESLSLIFDVLQHGSIEPEIPVPLLPNLTTLTVCVSTHKETNLAGDEPLFSLLRHWRLRDGSQLNEVDIFVRDQEINRVQEVPPNRDFRTFVQDFEIALNGCLFDDLDNPDGLWWAVEWYNEFDRTSPIMEDMKQKISIE